VDSDDQNRAGLQSLLSKLSGLTVVAHTAGAAQALEVLRDKPVDVALLDLTSADRSGIELTKQIRQSHPGVRVLIITASDSPDDIFDAMDAGADGYLLKGNASNVLEHAIGSVKLGTVWLDPDIAKQVLQVVETRNSTTARVLPTGLMILPLMPDEKTLLAEVASSSCVDGVCMVDPSFVKKLRRFSTRE
jgi:DNA-binding NarL/FixJ family response regulator